MSKEYNKNTINQAKSRLTPQQLSARTPAEMRLRYDTRSAQAQLRRARQKIKDNPFYVTHGKVVKLYESNFVTPRKLSTPTNELVNNNIYINITPVCARARVTGVPEKRKTEQKTQKEENRKPKRSMKDVPATIANWDYSKIVSFVDRTFGTRTSQKRLGKLRVFGLDALRYAVWAYKSYPHHRSRHQLTFDYFFVTAKNFSDDNDIRLNWRTEYYARA